MDRQHFTRSQIYVRFWLMKVGTFGFLCWNAKGVDLYNPHEVAVMLRYDRPVRGGELEAVGFADGFELRGYILRMMVERYGVEAHIHMPDVHEACEILALDPVDA